MATLPGRRHFSEQHALLFILLDNPNRSQCRPRSRQVAGNYRFAVFRFHLGHGFGDVPVGAGDEDRVRLWVVEAGNQRARVAGAEAADFGVGGAAEAVDGEHVEAARFEELPLDGVQLGDIRRGDHQLRRAHGMQRLDHGGGRCGGGDAAGAERLAAERSKRHPHGTLWNAVELRTIRAATELNRDQPARAIELLESAIPYERAFPEAPYLRGLAYLRLEKGPEARTEFRKILDHKGANWGLIYALSYPGLARAAALAGDTATARRAYQDFLALWKNADGDSAFLREVRRKSAAFGLEK